MRTFDLQECADFLKVDRTTAMKLAQQGDIVGARIGRAWVFLEDDVVAFLRERAQQQTLERLEGRITPNRADIDHRTQVAIQRQLQQSVSRKPGRTARALPRLPDIPANTPAAQAA
ncbi:helix-turn-helix domain-containing protein (plasmid) [Burkholderia vietnamiensis]|uniref:helix-turn-helix domain-containing protein n=1 Tax=Burkholderia vietnamiensis TaxID=60552 RepID=UPI002019909A|nr:helix-turn-helix domain-containing protein [Burkholderia vietnamiensis]MCO1349982.1 helix-turn-helix domain-containing protein [Burkholderia vietnamiensis]MCO1432452.1 helix-turn-helix domain-containing protein [Burkholderia vietnamiensis]UQN47387.1 helix-turn-helix domain-containing protein [Burkholderia vietnamiensis]